MRIVLFALVAAVLSAGTATAQLTIQRQGATFAVGNPNAGVPIAPKFLVFASYFSGASDRASNAMLEADFQYLSARGVNGVRIFANYWRTQNCTGFGSYDSSGVLKDGVPNSVNQVGLDRLIYVLGRAAAWGLVVDLSFARETVAPVGGEFTLSEYKTGISEVTKQLKTIAPHVIFDLENEGNGGGQGPTCPSAKVPIPGNEVWGMINAVKKEHAGRLVTISVANEWTPEQYGGVAKTSWPDPGAPNDPTRSLKFDFAAFHDSRQWNTSANPPVPKWAGYTGVNLIGPFSPPTLTQADLNNCAVPTSGSCRALQVNRLKTALAGSPNPSPMPVYFQEPDRWLPTGLQSNLTATHFLEAVSRAKYAGAAAWCMHTEARFLYVDGGTTIMGAPEWQFFDALAGTLAQFPWNP